MITLDGAYKPQAVEPPNLLSLRPMTKGRPFWRHVCSYGARVHDAGGRFAEGRRLTGTA